MQLVKHCSPRYKYRRYKLDTVIEDGLWITENSLLTKNKKDPILYLEIGLGSTEYFVAY